TRSTERQRQAVADDRVARGQLLEAVAKRASDPDPVLRGGLEEVEAAGRRRPQRTQQGPPQAEADGVGGEPCRTGHPGYAYVPRLTCRRTCPRRTCLPSRPSRPCRPPGPSDGGRPSRRR